MIYQINHDSIFRIGKSHKVCQDYAFSGAVNNIPFLIVSDGCSSSPNSDVGSRILAQCAKICFSKMFTDLKFDDKSYTNFGYTTISNATAVVNALCLNLDCLDATLILSFISGEGVITFMYGDGCTIKRGGIGLHTVECKFESGAPYYLSYWIDQERKEGYKKQFDKKLIVSYDEGSEIVENEFDHCLRFISPLLGYESFVIGSDGLTTFSNSIDISLSLNSIAWGVTAFKNTKGEFLKRRVLRLVNDNAKRDIYNLDDIGLAAFYINKEE